MSGDPRIAPSAARERRAFAAGLRPSARWLVLAGLSSAGLVALSSADAGGLARWAGIGATAAPADPDALLAGALGRLLAGTLGIAACVGCAVVIVTLVSGGLSPVSSAERRRLVLGPVAHRPTAALVGSIGLLVGMLALLRGLLAGAARAPAASETGLMALFGGAASRVLVVALGLFALAGTFELLLSRWANRRALFQSEAQARADSRGAGGRRG